MTEQQMEPIFRRCYIPIEVFNIDAYFTTSKSDFTAMCNWIKQEPVTNVDGRAMLNINEDGNVMIYIGWFGDNLSSLVHECVHAALYVASAIGHTVLENDEIVPYLTGYLFNKCREKAGK